MELFNTLTLVALCVVMEGFFSGTEIAFISLNRHKLAHRVEKGDRAAILLDSRFRSPANLYATTSIGTNIFVVSGAALMTGYFNRMSYGDADLLTMLVMAPATLLFGEIIPKAMFQRLADTISYIAIYPLVVAQKILSPVTWVSAGITRAMMRLAGVDENYDLRKITYEEIRHIFMMEEKKMDLHPDEQKMINRIFGLKNITVEPCMVPLIHLTAVEKNEPIASVRKKFEEAQFSRVPVFSERIFNIIGIINAFDVLRYSENARIAMDLSRPAFYVYKKKKVDNLLPEMQEAGVQMAVVVNEYSDAIGIVTREDLLEEIFGEIQDEYDKEQEAPQAREAGPNRWLADGMVEIDLLNERFNLGLPAGDYETLAGYLLTSLERIPRKGETISIGDYRFLIKDATDRGIRQVEISAKEPEQ